MAACAQGKRVRFFRVTELITQLLEAKEERQLQRYRLALNKLDLLVHDELGYVPASKAGAELLFDVIATAYERYSLIVTTTLPFETWTEVLGSERLTSAALDRLTHHCCDETTQLNLARLSGDLLKPPTALTRSHFQAHPEPNRLIPQYPAPPFSPGKSHHFRPGLTRIKIDKPIPHRQTGVEFYCTSAVEYLLGIRHGLLLIESEKQSMGITPADKIARWMSAAGQLHKSHDVEKRVVSAGEFLEKTAGLTEHETCSCLTGIDFSKPVSVVRLPDSVYVQYADQHKGYWFTDTGLTPDDVGLAKGRRVRKLYNPVGIVHALKSTARSIKDTWTAERLFQSISPAARGKLGQMTRGGGIQYIVFDKFRMKEI